MHQDDLAARSQNCAGVDPWDARPSLTCRFGLIGRVHRVSAVLVRAVALIVRVRISRNVILWRPCEAFRAPRFASRRAALTKALRNADLSLLTARNRNRIYAHLRGRPSNLGFETLPEASSRATGHARPGGWFAPGPPRCRSVLRNRPVIVCFGKGPGGRERKTECRQSIS